VNLTECEFTSVNVRICGKSFLFPSILYFLVQINAQSSSGIFYIFFILQYIFVCSSLQLRLKGHDYTLTDRKPLCSINLFKIDVFSVLNSHTVCCVFCLFMLFAIWLFILWHNYMISCTVSIFFITVRFLLPISNARLLTLKTCVWLMQVI